MDEKILSTDEMDALTKAVQKDEDNLSELFEQSNSERRHFERTGQLELMDCILAAFLVAAEKNLASFLRKKVQINFTNPRFGSVTEFVPEESKDKVFNVYYVISGNYFSLLITDFKLLHQVINVLFGGKVNPDEPVMSVPGNIGLMVSEKLSLEIMNAFAAACAEYGLVKFQLVRTSTLPVLVTRMSKNDRIYAITMEINFENFQGGLTVLLTADFMGSLSVQNAKVIDKEENDEHAKDRIEHTIMNSVVTVVASLPETTVSVNSLINLKPGDLLPVSNPSNVILSVGNEKLFTGVAGQSNSSLVVKLVDKFS